ncbi:MAG: UDP-N-acetylmuramoyl-tripeptide--D-alanyl-D-alanine ligase [Chloroflexi bacterium]|nr:UDP-N-acetylmuramoyl-tripeptide--D-alanyl-D-alanine ligase [Chloroflexota bacterium]
MSFLWVMRDPLLAVARFSAPRGRSRLVMAEGITKRARVVVRKTLTVPDVVAGLGQHLVRYVPCPKGPSFGRVVIDSREVMEGDLFVALRGEREDGHGYIPDALNRGATGVLAQDVPVGGEGAAHFFVVRDSLAALQEMACYWRDKHSVEMIAITGSVGKTTTKEAVASLLASRYQVLKSEGNLNNEIGVPLTLLGLRGEHSRGVVEMGMYALDEIRMLCRLVRPRVGVVTNVGHSHFGRLGSLERIAQAKGELVESLPSDGVAVLNGDDPRVKAMGRLTKAQVLYYGLGEDCHLRATNVESHGLKGLSFTLNWAGQSAPVDVNMIGRHSVYTALAAAAVGFISGLSWPEVVAGLKAVDSRLRLKVVPGIRESTIIDDTYNASPASVLAALDLLASMEGRRVAVLGDMLELGSYEEEGYRLVGRAAAQAVGLLITVGEGARRIGEEARYQGLREVVSVASCEEATQYVKEILAPGDCVLVKGSRGMAMEAIVEGIRAGP